MNDWQSLDVTFKWQLSDWTLLRVSVPLQVRAEGLSGAAQTVREVPVPAAGELAAGRGGFLIRNLAIAAELPVISRRGGYLCYVPLQYQHCYIDFGMSFQDYQKKFSSKTRSTINRKVRKYAEHCGGTLSWRTFREPGEMREFLALAGAVSKRTYQERLLDAGIPGDEAFAAQAETLAAEQRVRGYILFDGERPVSYLYCPVHDDTLIYAYLGYDPDYMHLSVGTVLQWLALEQMFAEGRFRHFDFTEGQSDHKRLFATHQRLCANVYLFRDTLAHRALVHSHAWVDGFSRRLGTTLDRLGMKAKIKHFIRFAT